MADKTAAATSSSTAAATAGAARPDLSIKLSVSDVLKSFPSPPSTPALPSRPGTSTQSVSAHISSATSVHNSCTAIQQQLVLAEETLSRALRSTRRRILGRLTRSQRGEVYDQLARIDSELRRVRGRVKSVEASYRRLLATENGFVGASTGVGDPEEVQKLCEEGVRGLKGIYVDCETHWRRIRKLWEDTAAWEAR